MDFFRCVLPCGHPACGVHLYSPTHPHAADRAAWLDLVADAPRFGGAT